MKIYDWFYEKGMKGDIGKGNYILFILIILVLLLCIFLMLNLKFVDMIPAEAEVAVKRVLLVKADEDGYIQSLHDGLRFAKGQPLYELIYSNGKKIYHAPYNGFIIQENISQKTSVYCKKGDVVIKIYDVKDLILRIPISEKISPNLVGNHFIAFYGNKVLNNRIDGTILFEIQEQPIAYVYSDDVPGALQPGQKIPIQVIRGNKKLLAHILKSGK